MNPRRRPRDLIDAIEAVAAQQGNIEAVDADYYRDFINLTQAQVEKLVVAIMLEHDREVRRLAVTEPKSEAVIRVARLVQNIMFMIGVGLARFDVFGRLTFVSRVGPEPFEVNLDEALKTRLAAIEPVVANLVRRSLPWLLSREMSQGELGL
jgi:hypothetical protein